MAAQATTITDLKGSFELLLTALKDTQGKFIDPTTNTIIATHRKYEDTELGGRAIANEANSGLEFKLLDDNIGYLKITGIITGEDFEKEAAAIRGAIDSLSKTDVIHWIIDLRYSRGGSVSPMIAGMGPLLGEGMIAALVDAKSKIRKLYEIHNGRFYDDQQLTLPFPCAKDMRSAKVAVLISKHTSGAAEILSIAMRGRKNTQFFGEPTAGQTTLKKVIPIRADLSMCLSESLYQDRRGTVYKKNIIPEIAVPFQAASDLQEDNAVILAMDWLGNSVINENSTARISIEKDDQ
jgi:carboxyl-terminal processing protease